MAEEHPESATGAARIYIAMVALALAFRGVEHYEWPWTADSVISFGLAAMLTIGDWRLPRLLQKLGPRATAILNSVASDPRWWIATILIYLLIGTFSPFMEQARWPFAWWASMHAPASMSANEVAKAVVSAITPLLDTSQQSPKQTPSDVIDLIASLRSKLDSANNTIDSQKYQIQTLTNEFNEASHPPAKVGPFESATLTLTVTKDGLQEDSAANARWMEWNLQSRGSEVHWSYPSASQYLALPSTQSWPSNNPDLSGLQDGDYQITKGGGTYQIFSSFSATALFVSFDKPVDTDKIQLSSPSSLPKWHNNCTQHTICAVWFDQRLAENITFTIQVGQR